MRTRLVGDAAAEWRSHWPVVLAGCAGMAISTINVYSTGLFMQPLETAFGWTRAQISAGPAIPAFATAILGSFAGAAMDRIGPRRIGIFGIASLVTLTAALGLVGPNIWSWWTIWIMLAILNTFIQPTIWTAAVSSFFSAGRGLALAVTLSGSGIASLVTPILAFNLIEQFGWRWAFVALAAIWGAIVLPLAWFFLTSRMDRERGTRGRAAPSAGSRRDGLRLMLSRRFIQLVLAAFLIAGVVVPLAVSLVPILSTNGLSRATAVGIAALLGLASIPGRLTVGYLLDRIEGRYLAAVSVSIPTISCLLLLAFPGSALAAAIAVLILGLALGAELDLVAYLASRHFPLSHFGLLFGSIAGLITLAGGGGPWAINLIYDATHSYRNALMLGVPMCLTSALLFLLLPPYPPTAQEE